MESSKLKVLFYLKKHEKNADGFCPVMGRIRVGSTMAQFSAKVLALESLWNSKSGRLTGKSSHASDVNAHLNDISVSINASYADIVNRTGKATAGQVKAAFQGMACTQETLLGYYERFVTEFRKRVGVDRTESTWNNYVSASRNLAIFIQERYSLPDIPFSGLTYSFIEDYDFWLRIVNKRKQGYIINLTGKLIFLINHAVSRGYLHHNPFIGYKLTKPNPSNKFLTEDELNRIMQTPLDKKKLYLTRDMFLLSCFTGLACIDLINLADTNLITAKDGVMWIKTFRQKTGVRVNVPLLEILIAILEKYKELNKDGKLLPMPSNSTLNDNLKIIAEKCGIERNLTFHMARHTYASEITLSQGVPLESVGSLLGHRNIKSTQIYAKVSTEKIKIDMADLETRIDHKFKFAI